MKTKLDEILLPKFHEVLFIQRDYTKIPHEEINRLVKEAKQQISDLIDDVIGEDEYIYIGYLGSEINTDRYKKQKTRNSLKKEQRERKKELI